MATSITTKRIARTMVITLYWAPDPRTKREVRESVQKGVAGGRRAKEGEGRKKGWRREEELGKPKKTNIQIPQSIPM
jgi:hypothetical protein